MSECDGKKCKTCVLERQRMNEELNHDLAIYKNTRIQSFKDLVHAYPQLIPRQRASREIAIAYWKVDTNE